MFHFSNLVRSKGDPKIISSGPSSLGSADRLARGLGWFSIGLGTLELLAPHRVTNALGMEGREGLVRAYGVRELLAGVLTLSVEKRAGLLSRVAGDGLDMATLVTELRPGNPRAGNVLAALVMVGGITVLDYMCAQDLKARHDPGRGRKRLYTDRSGFPKGIAAVKGAALPRPTYSAPAAQKSSNRAAAI
jgi:hypothetical protein